MKSSAYEFRSETAFHQACAGFLNARLMPPAWFTTFPAGGGGRDRGRQLKRMGLKAGVPDILLIRPSGHDVMGIDGFWMTLTFVGGIELKTKNGVVSAAQRQTHQDMIAAGAKIAIARSIDDLKNILTDWNFPLRSVSKSTERLMLSIDAWKDANFDVNSLFG